MIGLLTKARDFIIGFDRYAARVELKIDGEADAKSCIGALISLFSMIVSLYLSADVFLDYWNQTNPNVVTIFTYDTYESDFNFSNLFFSLSFYSPLRNDTRVISDQTNNLDVIYYIHPIEVQCTSCNSTENELNMCNNKTFTNVTLKSMTEFKSKNIMSVFSNYSFCLPDTFNGVLKENQNVTAAQDSSFQLFIPFSTTKVDFSTLKTNTQSVGDMSKAMQATTTTTTTTIQQPVVAPVVIPTQSTTQPSQNQPTNSNTTPTQPSGATTPTQPSGATTPTQPSGATTPTQPGGTTTPTQPSGATTPTQPGGTTTPTQPGGTNTPTQPGGTNTPTQPGGTTTPTQPGGTTTPIQPGGTTTPTQPGGTTTPTQPGGTQPNRILLNEPKIRKLATTTVDENTPVEQKSYIFLQGEMNKQKFPKMLLLHKDLEFNQYSSDKNKLANDIFKLEILDYKQPILDNPIAYDVFLQKISLKIIRPGLFFNDEPDPISYHSINSIKKNELDSLQNEGAYLSFKLLSDAKTIEVTYVSISDFFGAFGGYLAVFELFAGLATSLFTEHYLKQRMINSVFSLIYNEPKEETFKKNNNHKFRNSIFAQPLKKNHYVDFSFTNHVKQQYKENDRSSIFINKSSIEDISDRPVMEFYRENEIFEIQAKVNDFGVDVKQNTDPIPLIIMNEFMLDKKEFGEIEEKVNQEKENLVKYDQKSSRDIQSINEKEPPTSDKIIPLYLKEEIEMATIKNKKNEDKKLFDVYIKQIHKLNKKKHKKKNHDSVSIPNLVFQGWCDCFKSRKTVDKLGIIEKCDGILENICDLKYQSRMFFQFNLMKDFVFKPKQKAIFNQALRNLNIGEMEKTLEYMDSIYDDHKPFNYKEYKKIEDYPGKIKKDEQLLQSFMNIFNF